MSTSVAESIDAVFPDVMQKFAFSFVENCDKSELACPENGYIARVTFKGHGTGQTLVALPADMGAELAANIMGLEPGCDEARECATDSICELGNLICGNLLQATAGANTVFDLSAPEVSKLTPELWAELIKDESVRPYLVDAQHPVLLKFALS